MRLTLTEARERKGWNIPRLAAEAGIHKTTVYRLERGEFDPKHGTVTRLETTLGLKRGTLVFVQRHGAAA